MRNTFMIALFLMIFGAVATLLNDSGLFTYTVGTSTAYGNFDTIIASEITTGAAAAEYNPLGGITIIPTLISTVFGGLGAILNISSITSLYGIPLWMSVPLNAPIWLVYIVDLANWARNAQAIQ